MKTAWLHKGNNPFLIIFCNGWGMDEKPFQVLGSDEYDVLMYYDYRDGTQVVDFERVCRSYEKVSLIGWSMGVWVGQVLFEEHREKLDRSLAINGTLAPIDDGHGIPRGVFEQTHKHFDEEACAKFYKRMCGTREILDRFLTNQPQRSIESRRQELGVLLRSVNSMVVERSIYDEVIVADRDFIMPTRNQISFWKGGAIRYLRGSHFLFYRWRCWDELLDG